MFIVKNRRIFYTFSIVLILASIAVLSVWGLSYGIDFKGGSSVEFQYSVSRPAIDVVKAQVDGLNFEPTLKGSYTLVPTGDKGYVLNLRTVTEEERASLVSAISGDATNTVEIKKSKN